MIDHTLKLSLDSDRHLIVGDIHGRYDLFKKTLKAANYNPDTDVVYCVGDLIDRGDDSIGVLDFFSQPRCYSVAGNHELMAIDRDWYSTWIEYWVGGHNTLMQLEAAGRTHEWLKDYIRDLPWVIEVGDDDEEHAFRIVHAEVPPQWSTKEFNRRMNEGMNYNDPEFAPILWSRKLIGAGLANVKNMKPAATDINFHPDRHRLNFCGHSPIQKAMKVGDNWFIDTWASETMTIIDAVTQERFVASVDK